MDKNSRIDKAAEKFKKISEPESYHYEQKFKHLPSWLDNTSYFYQKEANKHLPHRYYFFRRGTVVRVNFGINMGSEFSNIHFAVVLDKHDSPKKRTLTVLPLTSKQKIGRFSLGKEVFNQTSAILANQLKMLAKEKLDLQNKLRNLSTNSAEYRSINDRITQLNNEGPKIAKVANQYKRYDKNSFVRLTDITTISKMRIEPINKYDPSGTIRLSSDQMNSISHELLKLYLSK